MFRPNSAIFRLEIQCQRKNYLSDLNAGVQGRGRDLVYKYGVSANTISATSPIFVNEISSPPLHICI